MAASPIVQAIIAGARARGIDPAAALAVASVEGLSGGVGDGGHAYGPFQLNNAGGVITGSHPGVNDPRIQQWATSAEGINFALDRIAAVAKGLKGRAAINAIVSKFERPANPTQEISRATAAYGKFGGSATAGAAPVAAVAAPQGVAAQGGPSPIAAALSMLGFAAPQGAFSQPPVAPVASPAATPVQPQGAGGLAIPIRGSYGSLAPSFLSSLTAAAKARGAVALEATSGERSVAHNAEIGGATHSNHLGDAGGFGHAMDGYAILRDGSRVPLGDFLKPNASSFGLRSGSTFNWNGKPDVVHVDDFRNGGR